MVRRGFLLTLLIFVMTLPAWCTADISLFGEISQGFPVFNDDFDTYRAPTGVGIGLSSDGFWKGLNVGGSFAWNGYPPNEGEESFGESWMITGLISAGWLFSLLSDSDTYIGIGPVLSAGFYTRRLSWNDRTTTSTRPMVRFSLDGVLKTDDSMYFSTAVDISGYLDIDPVWAFSLGIGVGYSFRAGR